MKKIRLLSSLLLAFFISVTVFVYGGADFTNKIISSVASFVDVIPTLAHTPITEMLNDKTYLNVKVVPHFGRLCDSVANAKIVYYLGATETNVKERALNSSEINAIRNDEPFYINTTEAFDLSSVTEMHYKIIVGFNKVNSTIETVESIKDGYHKINIKDYIVIHVDGYGGTVTVPNGDQSDDQMEVTFPDGQGGDVEFTIDDDTDWGDWGDWDDFEFAPSADMVKITGKTVGTVAEFPTKSNESITFSAENAIVKNTLNFDKTKIPAGTEYFVLAFAPDYNDKGNKSVIADSLGSKNNPGCNLSVDIEKGTYSFTINGGFKVGAKAHIWLLAATDNITDLGSCRPKRRAVIKGRGVFEFNGLQQGDVLKIFNVSGKKIREISSGDATGFVWDGRTDSGEWAKSGIYIYQIKVNGNARSGRRIKVSDKLISGTIVFAK